MDLRNKSVDWFLYDRDLRHESVKPKIRTLSYYNFPFQLLLEFSPDNTVYCRRGTAHVFFVLFLITIIFIE